MKPGILAWATRRASTPMRSLALLGSVACLWVLGGCVGASLRTSGADNIADLQAEDRYAVIYADQMAKFQLDLQPLVPTATSPGVCNKGGTKQGCYDADVQLIGDLQDMVNALATTPVPPRFANADKLLRDALAENIRALELRNQAIAKGDDAIFQEHQVVMAQALEMLAQAYEAFPEDNRPQPRP